MFKQIDESNFLIRFLERLSAFIAKRRGLGILLGLLLIVVGFFIQIINVEAQSAGLEYLQIVLHNVGIIVALIAILLVEPLGA